MSKVYTVIRVSSMMTGINRVQDVVDTEIQSIINFLPGNTTVTKTTTLAIHDLSIPVMIEMESDFFVESVMLEFKYHRYVIPDGIKLGKRLHQGHVITDVTVMPIKEGSDYEANSEAIANSLT